MTTFTDFGRIPQVAPKSKPNKHPPIQQTPSGAHTGGACNGCGRTLTYWLHYKLCDGCLIVGSRPSRSIGAGHDGVTPVRRSVGVSRTLGRITTTTGSGRG